jgi:DNA invertase Pin-like site-specific DNA recombinase
MRRRAAKLLTRVLYRKPVRETGPESQCFCGSEAVSYAALKPADFGTHQCLCWQGRGGFFKMTRRVAFYLRVSTGEQTTENQRRELEAVARHRGWEIVAVYEDQGISGAKGRDKRPQFDRMLRDVVRGKFDVLAAWAVDRLGRSLQDLVTTLGELRAAEIDLFLHQQAVDTTTPSGRAMFGMLGVFAEFERAMIQDRVKAGLARARAAGKTLGRPRVVADEQGILEAVQSGLSIRKTAKLFGASPAKVQRVLAT